MSEMKEAEIEPVPPKSKKGLLVGLMLALATGGGAFYAVYSGLVLGSPDPHLASGSEIEETELATFVQLTPLVVSLGARSNYQLRFNAQLEVEPSRKADVENLTPRILDVLNGYLRAVDISQLQNPTSLVRLRAQMLRRIQLVTGSGHVRDLLITEFVLT